MMCCRREPGDSEPAAMTQQVAESNAAGTAPGSGRAANTSDSAALWYAATPRLTGRGCQAMLLV